MRIHRARWAMVSVVIVNYRTPDLTQAAVASALGEPETGQVVVVDNASPDGSGEVLRESLRDPRVLVFQSRINGGFGYANNLGAWAATEPNLFLLNSDATFQPGCLAKILPRLGDPSVGIVAPRLTLADGVTVQADGHGPFPTCARIFTRRSKRYGNSLEPDWVSGAAMLMRRDEFLGLGGFDERIFMYYEDVELCWRYRKSGKRIVRELSGSVTHLGGGSATSDWSKKRMYYKNQETFLRLIGESPAAIASLRPLRWPNLWLGRVLRRSA